MTRLEHRFPALAGQVGVLTPSVRSAICWLIAAAPLTADARVTRWLTVCGRGLELTPGEAQELHKDAEDADEEYLVAAEEGAPAEEVDGKFQRARALFALRALAGGSPTDAMYEALMTHDDPEHWAGLLGTQISVG